jgi:hypothetical protein
MGAGLQNLLGQKLKADFEEQMARAKNERRSTMSVFSSGVGAGSVTRAVGSPKKTGGESVKRSGRSTAVQSPARRMLTNKAANNGNEATMGFG